MARRTKQEAYATREQLLDAAEALFLTRGLNRCALQDIAHAAGLTRGALYWHFEDKVALVQALLDRVDLPMEQALRDAEQDPSRNAMLRLRTLALAPFALMKRDPRARSVFALMLQRNEFVDELAPLTSRHDEALERWNQHMERLFLVAQRDGQLKPGISPRVAATALLALLDGLMRLTTLSQDPSAQRSAEPAIGALLAGLSRPEPVSPTTNPASDADADADANADANRKAGAACDEPDLAQPAGLPAPVPAARRKPPR